MSEAYDAYKAKTCRYCETELNDGFLDLGVMPLANSLVKPEDKDKEEFQCPLTLTLCPSCRLVQLTHVVPPDLMFSHYLYVSSTTQTFRDHFAAYASSVKDKLSGIEEPLGVDIGSNDGLLLSCYEKQGMRAVGVDPAKNLADQANANGLKTLNRYFDESCVAEIIKTHGKAHAISGNNVFAHIHDVKSVCRNVCELLDDRGLFVIEFPYLLKMTDELLFDMIYHEHLSYIAVNPLKVLLKQFDLEIFHIDEVESHGGSLRVFIQKTAAGRTPSEAVERLSTLELTKGFDDNWVYDRFASQVLAIKDQFCQSLGELKKQGKKIAGYGAPAKASTIMNFYGLGLETFEYVVDDNPLKQKYLMPGVHVPIVPGTTLDTDTPDVIVIFAWNFAKEIMNKMGKYREQGVRFMIPLPVPQPAGVTSEQFQFDIA